MIATVCLFPYYNKDIMILTSSHKVIAKHLIWNWSGLAEYFYMYIANA